MTRKEIIKTLAEYEKNFPVDTYKIKGIHIWPVLRILTAFSLYTQQEDAFVLLKRNCLKHYFTVVFEKIKLLINRFRVYVFEYKHNQSIRKKNIDFLVLTDSIDRRIKIDDKWFNIFFDSLGLLYPEFKYLILERIVDNTLRTPRYSKSYSISNKLLFISFIQKIKIFSARKLLPPDWFLDYDNWNKKNGITSLSYRQICSITSSIIKQSYYYEKILLKITPKAILLIEWYSLTSMPLTIAANRRGIPVVDVQHGMQSSSHFAYSKWHKSPKEGFACIPYYFWVWGPYYYQILKQNNSIPNFDEARILQGGSAWLNYSMEEKSAINTQDIVVPDLFNLAKKKILVTLQPLSNFSLIWEIIRNSRKDFLWLVRLHPSMKDVADIILQLKLLKDKGFLVEYDFSSHASLYLLFKLIDVHITAFSTCAVEAIPFGIKTILLHKNGAIEFSDFISRGLMYYSEKPAEVNDYIVRIDKNMDKIDFTIFVNSEATRKVLKKLIGV